MQVDRTLEPDRGMTLIISLTSEEVAEIQDAIEAGSSRTRAGEQQERDVRDKYGDPVVQAVIARNT